jgi:putative CocE/NonD family hydrolase
MYCLPAFIFAQSHDALFVTGHYDKQEYRVPMRDGVELFTSVYTPKDRSRSYPILLLRTPYGVSPYGDGHYRDNLGPSPLFMRELFIFVYQDVRGKYMSDGVFDDMRPQVPGTNEKQGIDESTDTYDTIDWLIRNLKGHNGRVGMWGISYPGFYAAAGLINTHPNLVAVSPQAPIADWFWDDFHHHGALFLAHCFNFMSSFDRPRHGLTTKGNPRFDHGTPDGYEFFLRTGSAKILTERYMGDSLRFWTHLVTHPNYDSFWQARNLLPHLRNIHCAVLTVGGWLDAEDLYGPLKIYQTIEKENPGIENTLVMGPWRHGGWARGDGASLGNVFFGDNPAPSDFYQNQIEFPFFMRHLKQAPYPPQPEAYVFETGTNQWRIFATYPPANRETRRYYFQANGGLSPAKPAEKGKYDEFVSDPEKPVPFTEEIAIGMTREYMTDDQRFAARRPDVLVYQTEALTEDVTLSGGILAHLMVSTSETDADWIVKLIDVYPDDQPAAPHQPDKPLGAYQQMVRSDVIRGRFRNSYEKPEPFVSGKVTQVDLPLQDVLHTFRKGHRMMVQVQSTWFPLIDRNPQHYIDNIYEAVPSDFRTATHRVYRSGDQASWLEVGVLRD